VLASMHRLSELARYRPTLLSRHFELDQNWLLSEFIRCSPQEFIDQIACEMTNQDFMFRGHRGKQ
ncbi:MAG TPA: YaaC family protein, partial [Oligoflexia bacterium]|nr:YaaC family protein [Oligoflexia bacterium]